MLELRVLACDLLNSGATSLWLSASHHLNVEWYSITVTPNPPASPLPLPPHPSSSIWFLFTLLYLRRPLHIHFSGVLSFFLLLSTFFSHVQKYKIKLVFSTNQKSEHIVLFCVVRMNSFKTHYIENIKQIDQEIELNINFRALLYMYCGYLSIRGC